ncbi:BREX-1 system adenine-specific DNA-methyltransferase PglX [Ruminococcus bromii]|uniref:BREX-1 system adenine-specific DNA-methyltransferase PglX n=1 Tax=Ruminococcus bromii TaxID=40518 RepID=UPI003A8D9884
MNKTAIKNFAIWARNKLRADIILKAGLLGITEKEIANPLPQSTDDLQIFDIGTSQPVRLEGKTAIDQRKSLVAAIRAKNLKHAEAVDAVIEEVAYTWFNRLIAVRFMEVNDYLPSRIRVLSSENPAKAEPDFVTNPFDTDLDFTEDEINLIDNLKDNNKSDELFQFLFIKQCNKLNEILPVLFEKTNDYTELLLNVSFTDKDGVVYHLVHDISEDDFNVEKQGQVEIIGWLYQYYNTEPKDKVFGRPSGQKIRKEDVPAATQLFTPDWIVRYMVENSLGRIAIHNLKYGDWDETERAKIDTFKSKWKYYLEEAEQSPEIVERFRMEESRKYNKGDVPPYVDSTFLDPCMGSGHILVYAFDVFMDIYTAQGYTERDAAQHIVEKNLYGLELDDRATQLAYFAVMMKARSYDRRFFTRGIRPNLCSIQESNNLNSDYLELFGDLKSTAQKLVDEFIDAKEYGSILNLKITTGEIAQLETKYAEIDNTIYDNILDTIRQVGLRTIFEPLIRQAKIMVKKYEVVCTNPPYMGGSGFSQKLGEFAKRKYPNSKSDLSTVFMEKCTDFCNKNGFFSMINIPAWMFLSSYEKLRKGLSNSTTYINMSHFGRGVFGSDFGTTAFVIKKEYIKGYYGTYKRLFKKQVTVTSCENLRTRYLSNQGEYKSCQDKFSLIPGNPIAYWVSDHIVNTFRKYPNLGENAEIVSGMTTGNNDIYMRAWQEVDFTKVALYKKSLDEVDISKTYWFPYNKGGPYRRWYGNNFYLVNWARHNEFNRAKTTMTHIYLKPCLTWSDITFDIFSARACDAGFFFDVKGSCAFPNEDMYYPLLALLNSTVTMMYIKMLNPTVTTQVGDLKRIPFDQSLLHNQLLIDMAKENVSLVRNDWDSMEISWDFKGHPLTRDHYSTLDESYNHYISQCKSNFEIVKNNDIKLNEIIANTYQASDIETDVSDDYVAIDLPSKTSAIKTLLSYFVGCLFGRYSLNREGLVFAGGNFDEVYWRFQGQAALDKNGNPIQGAYAGMSNAEIHYPRFKDSEKWENATVLRFEPDADNCIPITDTAYFEDDIVGRFCEFVKVVYGEDTLEANLEFIAKALGNKGNTSRDIIRNYFLNDFFKDHCKIYQKRPIYWLFDSGKQNGFKALCYMHRWNADTIGNMRVEYLHRIQRTYEKEIEREQDTIDNTTNNRDKAAAIKRKEKLLKQLKEAKDYDAKVAHLALSRPDIDLDDGVKVNYEKVQTAQDGKKLQILAKI